MDGTAWWHFGLGIGLLVALMVVPLVSAVHKMLQLRKERKLWGYDTKQFGKAERCENEEG